MSSYQTQEDREEHQAVEEAKRHNKKEHLRQQLVSAISVQGHLEESCEEVVVTKRQEDGCQHGAQPAVQDCRPDPIRDVRNTKGNKKPTLSGFAVLWLCSFLIFLPLPQALLLPGSHGRCARRSPHSARCRRSGAWRWWCPPSGPRST